VIDKMTRLISKVVVPDRGILGSVSSYAILTPRGVPENPNRPKDRIMSEEHKQNIRENRARKPFILDAEAIKRRAETLHFNALVRQRRFGD
jgi:hypothetical protein